MNIKELLYWIAFLPCAIIGSVLAAVLVGLLCLIGDIFDGSFWIYIKNPEIFYLEHFFTPFITTAVLCGMFVFIGSSIVPKFKRQIGYALSIIVAIIFGILAFFGVLTHEWKIFAQSLLGIVVAAVVSYSGDYEKVQQA